MTYKSDEEIHSEALFQLDWDSRLKQSDIGVTVKKGVVTLTGTVDSYAKKLAAQKAAHMVPGVLDVANDIEVKVTGSLRHCVLLCKIDYLETMDEQIVCLPENAEFGVLQ